MRKKGIAILLGVAMALSVAACGAEKNQFVEANRVQIVTYDEKESIDQKIVGAWDSMETENKGDKSIEIGDIAILPNGIVWGSYFVRPSEYIDGTVEAKKIMTNDNEINIWEIYKQIKVAKGEWGEEEANRYVDMKVTYEFKDIPDSSYKNNVKYFYENDAYDQLILHITGSYKESPTSLISVNVMEVYEKDYPMYTGIYYGYMTLVGDWEDNMGNQWNFQYEKDKDGSWQLIPSMTDAEGKKHEGKAVYFQNNFGEDIPKEQVRFCFEDFSTEYYTIVSYDGKTFNFDDNGSSFVLTRK